MARSEINILVTAIGAALRSLTREQAARLSNQLVDMLDWTSPRERLLIAMDAAGICASGDYRIEQTRLVECRATRRATKSEPHPDVETIGDAETIQGPPRHYETVKNNDHCAAEEKYDD